MKQEDLVIMIQKYLRPHNRICPYSSYGLKHLFEGLARCYISNYDFKQAMWRAGVTPCKIWGDNYYYKIKVVVTPEIPSGYVSKRRVENGRV